MKSKKMLLALAAVIAMPALAQQATPEAMVEKMTDPSQIPELMKDPKAAVPAMAATMDPAFATAMAQASMDPATYTRMMAGMMNPAMYSNWMSMMADPNVYMKWMAAGMDPNF
ncbi:MAG TPA: hypothetical protein VLT88_11825, partial [Desulfosarcina sp.]|nr:hypothetical protein [Desulfosarcina sp.]